MKRIYLIAGVVITALSAVPFRFALAQSDTLKEALQGVTNSASQIATSSFATSTGAEADITLRQTALIKIFDLSLVEIKELKDKLAAAKGDIDPELLAMRDRFIEDLGSYLPRVTDQKKVASADGITLEAIQDSAADVKAWRENVYDPETKMIVDLLFVLQGKQVLKTADLRYEKISSDVKQLQAALGPGALTLKPYLTQALKELRAARSLQTQAQDVLTGAFDDAMSTPTSTATQAVIIEQATSTTTTTALLSASPATTSEATTTLSTSSAGTSTTEVEASKPTVQELMKSVYSHVSQVYKLFFKMSKLASDLLSQ